MCVALPVVRVKFPKIYYLCIFLTIKHTYSPTKNNFYHKIPEKITDQTRICEWIWKGSWIIVGARVLSINICIRMGFPGSSAGKESA